MELTGRWERLRADGSWGDTIEYRADGTILGSATRGSSPSTQWNVVRTRGDEAFCTMNASKPSCEQFRLVGDTLIFGRIASPTYLRRVR